MLCTTTRKGMECFFMTPRGCSFNGGTCHEAIDKCNGCAHLVTLGERRFCKAFPDPAAKWAFGTCNLATHVERKVKEEVVKKVNPLKASKRSATGKG